MYFDKYLVCVKVKVQVKVQVKVKYNRSNVYDLNEGMWKFMCDDDINIIYN